MLALVPCASGAPVEDAPTDGPQAGDPSGDEGEAESSSDKLTEVFESVLLTTQRHEKEVRALSFRAFTEWAVVQVN